MLWLSSLGPGIGKVVDDNGKEIGVVSAVTLHGGRMEGVSIELTILSSDDAAVYEMWSEMQKEFKGG